MHHTARPLLLPRLLVPVFPMGDYAFTPSFTLSFPRLTLPLRFFLPVSYQTLLRTCRYSHIYLNLNLTNDVFLRILTLDQLDLISPLS